MIEGAAGGDVEAAVAPLAEGHARSPHRAGRHGRRRRRARHGAAHPALRQVEAERASQSRGPRAGRADHRRRADLAALGDDAGDGAGLRRHGLDRTVQVQRGAVGDGGPRERVGRLLGIGVAVARRVHAADPAAGEPGDDRVEIPRAEQASRRARTRARPAATPRSAPAATRRRPARDCRPGPTRCRRPARARGPARGGWPRRRAAARADRAPAGERSPSSSATARRAPAARSTTTTRAPRRARKYAVAQPTMPAPDDDDVRVTLHGEAHRRSKTTRCQTLDARKGAGPRRWAAEPASAAVEKAGAGEIGEDPVGGGLGGQRGWCRCGSRDPPAARTASRCR